LYFERPVTFPLTYPYVTITLGAGISNRYHYFYDWRIRPLSCGTAALPYTVNVLPSPQVNLPAYTQQCGGSVLLDATNIGATYLWSNGATTQDLSGLCEGAYMVTLTDGNGCMLMDTITIASDSVVSVNFTEFDVVFQFVSLQLFVVIGVNDILRI